MRDLAIIALVGVTIMFLATVGFWILVNLMSGYDVGYFDLWL